MTALKKVEFVSDLNVALLQGEQTGMISSTCFVAEDQVSGFGSVSQEHDKYNKSDLFSGELTGMISSTC